MASTEELLAAFRELDERARVEPRLEQYRVAGKGVSALVGMPEGWWLSDCISMLAVDGGWWPGYWDLQFDSQLFVEEILIPVPLASEARQTRTINWVQAGEVWERDSFYSPLRRQPAASAPLLGFSSQSLWKSMVFPHEVALLEAFIATFDEMGIGEDGTVNPFFVEWITDPPMDEEGEGAARAHQRLVELSAEWETDHPCWHQDAMPSMDVQRPGQSWSTEVIATILGVAETHVADR